MDVRIEAAPVTFSVSTVDIVVTAVKKVTSYVTALIGRVASFPRSLSFNSVSLSAVAPDFISDWRMGAV